jgi:hypothetical protein
MLADIDFSEKAIFMGRSHVSRMMQSVPQGITGMVTPGFGATPWSAAQVAVWLADSKLCSGDMVVLE